MKKTNGFTLIELLIVVGVIGILAGVSIRVLNPERQKQTAEDAVIRKNIYDTAMAIETFYVAEGYYPDEGGDRNPLTGTDSAIASVYLSEWPEGLFYNNYVGVSGLQLFSVHAKKASSGDFFKYNNEWKEIRECPSTMTPENNIRACEPE